MPKLINIGPSSKWSRDRINLAKRLWKADRAFNTLKRQYTNLEKKRASRNTVSVRSGSFGKKYLEYISARHEDDYGKNLKELEKYAEGMYLATPKKVSSLPKGYVGFKHKFYLTTSRSKNDSVEIAGIFSPKSKKIVIFGLDVVKNKPRRNLRRLDKLHSRVIPMDIEGRKIRVGDVEFARQKREAPDWVTQQVGKYDPDNLTAGGRLASRIERFVGRKTTTLNKSEMRQLLRYAKSRFPTANRVIVPLKHHDNRLTTVELGRDVDHLYQQRKFRKIKL